jgi:hypothetical protein
VDQFDHLLEDGRIETGQHAVPEVEDVARMAVVVVEHPAHLDRHGVPIGGAGGGIEVALERDPATGAGPGHPQRGPPVDTDHVGAGLGELVEQFAGVDPEVDARHTELGHGGQHPGGVGEHEAAVVVGVERPRPGVEQLDHSCACADLGDEGGDGEVGEPVAEVVPQRRVVEHQRLGAGVVT